MSATSPGCRDDDPRVAALLDALRARDDFIAVAGHELRNPMTPIVMQLDVLRQALRDTPGIPPKALVALDRLQWAMTNYVRRATVLLDVSRITSGKLAIDPDSVDASEVVRQVVADMRPMTDRMGVSFALDIEDAATAVLDRLALEQIADNLLSNAVKYGAGKPIDVGLWRRGEWLRLVVRDRGIGIGAEDHARIFGRFERAVTRRQHGGFGVGLWLVRQLAEAHGGRITVDAAPGHGSVFTVELPLAQAAHLTQDPGSLSEDTAVER